MENLLFYGGMICMGSSLLLFFVLIPVFRLRRRRLAERLEKGED